MALAVIANSRKLDRSAAGDLKKALADAGLSQTPWLDITKGREAKHAANKAIEDGADTVLVCGGDGTVRAAAEALVHRDVALAVLPAGSANLFATGLGLPDKPAEVIDLIVRGERRVIDTGVCKGMTFAVMAGTGFDAHMIAEADSAKERLGAVAYVKSGVEQARARRRFDAEVTVDGRELFDGPTTCVLVGNLGRLKAGVVAFPDASPTDGELDVGVVTAAGWREWASVMLGTVRRKPERSPFVHVDRGKTIRVRLEKKQLFELDGGAKGRSRKLTFKNDPESLVVCAPVVPA